MTKELLNDYEQKKHTYQKKKNPNFIVEKILKNLFCKGYEGNWWEGLTLALKRAFRRPLNSFSREMRPDSRSPGGREETFSRQRQLDLMFSWMCKQRNPEEWKMVSIHGRVANGIYLKWEDKKRKGIWRKGYDLKFDHVEVDRSVKHFSSYLS